jgi:hypothetical protein
MSGPGDSEGGRKGSVRGDASVDVGLPARGKGNSTTGTALRMDEGLGTTGSGTELEYH